MVQNKFQDFAKELIELCDKYNYQLEGYDDSSVMVTLKGECAYFGKKVIVLKLAILQNLLIIQELSDENYS